MTNAVPWSYVVDDYFVTLTIPLGVQQPFDRAIASFAAVSLKKDTIQANASRGILPPVEVTFTTEVWSWVHIDGNGMHSRSTSALPSLY